MPEASIQNTNKTLPLIHIVWHPLKRHFYIFRCTVWAVNFYLCIDAKKKTQSKTKTKTLIFNYLCKSSTVNVIPGLSIADEFEQKAQTLNTWTTRLHTTHRRTAPCSCKCGFVQLKRPLQVNKLQSDWIFAFWLKWGRAVLNPLFWSCKY